MTTSLRKEESSRTMHSECTTAAMLIDRYKYIPLKRLKNLSLPRRIKRTISYLKQRAMGIVRQPQLQYSINYSQPAPEAYNASIECSDAIIFDGEYIPSKDYFDSVSEPSDTALSYSYQSSSEEEYSFHEEDHFDESLLEYWDDEPDQLINLEPINISTPIAEPVSTPQATSQQTCERIFSNYLDRRGISHVPFTSKPKRTKQQQPEPAILSTLTEEQRSRRKLLRAQLNNCLYPSTKHVVSYYHSPKNISVRITKKKIDVICRYYDYYGFISKSRNDKCMGSSPVLPPPLKCICFKQVKMPQLYPLIPLADVEEQQPPMIDIPDILLDDDDIIVEQAVPSSAPEDPYWTEQLERARSLFSYMNRGIKPDLPHQLPYGMRENFPSREEWNSRHPAAREPNLMSNEICLTFDDF
jgi:hypothetical protein